MCDLSTIGNPARTHTQTHTHTHAYTPFLCTRSRLLLPRVYSLPPSLSLPPPLSLSFSLNPLPVLPGPFSKQYEIIVEVERGAAASTKLENLSEIYKPTEVINLVRAQRTTNAHTLCICIHTSYIHIHTSIIYTHARPLRCQISPCAQRTEVAHTCIRMYTCAFIHTYIMHTQTYVCVCIRTYPIECVLLPQTLLHAAKSQNLNPKPSP